MQKSIGFWQSWALVVGTMIGSGIFLLPSVLAQFGSLSLLGWFLTAIGTLLIALSLGSLSSRIDKEGGPYAYCYEVIGPVAGFIIGWGLWISFWVSIAASSVAFAGYASTILPSIEHDGAFRTLVSLMMVWTLGAIFIFGIRGVGMTQLITTVMKLIPLLLIPTLGYVYAEQSVSSILSYEASEGFFATIAKVVLITMWAFLGIEVATIPAKETLNAKKTIPRALFFGLLSVTFVYFFATLGLWFLLPTEVLSQSPSPFADAAEVIFGPVGATFVALGIMISIIGSVNGCLVGTVLLPESMSDDGLFPAIFSHRNRFGIAWKSLLIALVLISAVLMLNSNSHLVGVYELLIVLSTLTAILPYAASAIADLIVQCRNKPIRGIKLMSILRAVGALVFSVCMILGAGFDVILYGIILIAAGLPIYWWVKRPMARG
ncbi:APC family permease [Alteromonas facilis]|uniref:APC family permease n=1 Tax=Alteromonas facilis TaxID=2048004 RepID=UPI000C28831B|nr:amino acid permease [Alteromonas facilis]